MPCLANDITENRLNQSWAPPRYRPERGLVAVIVRDKAFQHAFRHTAQQSSPGRENFSGLSEIHAVLQTVLEVADDGFVGEVATRSAVYDNGDELSVDAVLGCNGR